MTKEIKGLGNTFLRVVKRVLEIGHDDDGYIEVNGKRFFVLDVAITGNVTTIAATAPLAIAGSEGRTTHATGKGKVFTSDGTKWQQQLAVEPLEAGTHVAALTDSSGGATANGTIEAITNAFGGRVYLGAVAAATTTGAVTQKDLNGISPGATATVIAQPKNPRNVKLTITDGNTSISAYNITVAGKAPDGTTVSETFTQADGLTPTGSKVFASITSVTINTIAGNGAGDTLDMGYGSKLGVPLPYGSTGLTVLALAVDGTLEAASATDQTNNSFTPTTAPNASHVYDVQFAYANPSITLLTNAVKELATKQNAVISSLEGNGVLADS